MQSGLAHRGPDGAGHWVAPDHRVGLAMRRLSIIDLNGGWQPLYNEARDIVLVANGEIYNFLELRESLREKGHNFATSSDCEVIIHNYEEKGSDFLADLRGMFAFALFDLKRQTLTIARDRMGEKPLYLHDDGDTILFASELKSMLASGDVALDLDPQGIYWYFHYGYVPDPKSPIRNVRKLPAGHVLTLDLNDWTQVERAYWRLEDAPEIDAEPVQCIRNVLEEVSRIVVRSDVNVGVALSGGLDSSIVAALAAKAYPGTLQAFSVGYEGRPPCDERDDARLLANHLNIPFIEVELRTDEMVAGFADLARLRDDPIADIAGWGYYQVMRAARAHDVPVMLQGQGGDELFWGYPWVRQAARENRYRQTGNVSWWELAQHTFETRPPLRPMSFARWGRDGLKRYLRRRRAVHDPAYPSFLETIAFFNEGVALPYADRFRDAVRDLGPAADAREPYRADGAWGNVDVMTTRMVCDTYLRQNGVAQGDRLSMAASVELRLPLLDHRLVETVVGLRKVHSDIDLAPKAWLRAAAAPFLPAEVLNRPKRGFSPPTREWHSRLFARHGSALADGILVQHSVLDPAGARHLSRGEQPDHAVIPMSFKALVLEFWLRAMSEEMGRAVGPARALAS